MNEEARPVQRYLVPERTVTRHTVQQALSWQTQSIRHEEDTVRTARPHYVHDTRTILNRLISIHFCTTEFNVGIILTVIANHWIFQRYTLKL